MTQKELLNLDHLKIAEVKEGYFLHVHTEEGFYITSWKEDEDIKEYSSSECMYAPIKDEYEDYRIITAAENEEYERLSEEAVEEEMSNRDSNKDK